MKRGFGLVLAVPAALGLILGYLLTLAKRVGGKYWAALIVGILLGVTIVKTHHALTATVCPLLLS